MNANRNLFPHFQKRAALCALLFVACLSLSAQSAKQLLILHTSDAHSCIEPDSKSGQGGFIRRATLVDSLRGEDPSLLLFDCGDFSQGSLYYNLFKGETEVELMNLMGYTAGTIGNHEFDFGMDNMARLFRMAQFPIVSCNYDVRGTVLEDVVKPYVILEQNGLRIGVLGVNPPLKGLVSEKNSQGVTYLDPIEKVQETATYLKKEAHCDVIICLSHLGWQFKEKIGDTKLIASTRYIDLVLGGHTHSEFDKPLSVLNLDGKPVALMHVGKSGRYIGKLQLKVR